MTYAEFHDALQVLGLREWSTLREIRGRHRELVKLYHPDTGGEPNNERGDRSFPVLLAVAQLRCE